MSRLLAPNLSMRDRLRETRAQVSQALDVGIGEDPFLTRLLLRQIVFALLLLEEELIEQEEAARPPSRREQKGKSP
jgi:hypothetical protein